MSWPTLKVLLDHIQSQPRQTMQPQKGYLRHFILFFSHANNTWQINEGFWNCDWHHDARSTALNIWAKSTLVRSSEESKNRLHLPVVVKSPCSRLWMWHERQRPTVWAFPCSSDFPITGSHLCEFPSLSPRSPACPPSFLCSQLGGTAQPWLLPCLHTLSTWQISTPFAFLCWDRA